MVWFQVIDLMRDKIATLKELIEKYRPRDPTKRSSLADELMYIRGQLVESRFVCNLKLILQLHSP